MTVHLIQANVNQPQPLISVVSVYPLAALSLSVSTAPLALFSLVRAADVPKMTRFYSYFLVSCLLFYKENVLFIFLVCEQIYTENKCVSLYVNWKNMCT